MASVNKSVIKRPHTIGNYAGTRRPPDLDDWRWLIAEYMEKQRNIHDIAEELGCSPVTVSNAIHRLNAQLPHPRGTRPKLPRTERRAWRDRRAQNRAQRKAATA